jgi:hypothetical protein
MGTAVTLRPGSFPFLVWRLTTRAISLLRTCKAMPEKVKAGFLFTLKIDAAGKWKIVKTLQMSDKEIEKMEEGE